MPLSSKKIIEHINSLPQSFTKQSLVDYFIDAKIAKSKKKKPTKKKKVYKQDKDLKKIEETVSKLVSSGFLACRKNKIYKLHPLEIEGYISVNSSGNGLVIAFEGDEFIIKEKDIGFAKNNDFVSIAVTDYRKGIFHAKVIKVLERDREIYTAKIIRKTKGVLFFKLLDVPGEVEVCAARHGDSEPREDDVVVVKMSDGLIANRAKCEVLHFYSIEDEEHDIDRIRAKYDLPQQHGEYPELENIEDSVSPFELKNRKDYRSLFTITIDGEDARDFDDAISIEQKGQDTVLYVHIADVSAYVKPGFAIDQEALKRGTSYYLGNTVIPMLPEKLSNNLCSLTEGTEKLTMSVEITFDKHGNVKDYSFFRGLIISDRRLTYTISQQILQQKKPGNLYDILSSMDKLADILKAKRMKAGRLDLNLPEAKLVYKDNKVTGLKVVERLKSHMIIEEFMLSANEVVSRSLTRYQVPTLHRIHEAISEDSMLSLQYFLRHLGIKFDSKRLDIQGILDSVAGEEYEQVVNLVVLKSLMQAYYGIDPLGHFGLGFKDYTHFTSPIRRYPDLIVHRCLKALIDKVPPVYGNEQLTRIGEISSQMERVAQKAERDLVKIKSCRLLANRIGDEFEGIISGISKYGFYVTLSEMPIEGMVPMRNLTNDFFLAKEDEYTIVGLRFGKRYRLGDHVRITVENVELERMRIDFDLA